MARDKKPVFGSAEPQQEEMTVVVFKFKGGAESMQKGFDAVNNAIAALGPSQGGHHQRTIVQRSPSQLAAPAQNADAIDAVHEDVAEETDAEETMQEAAASFTNGKPKKALAPKQSFLSEFNLVPTDVQSWKDYAAKKSPQTENDKFLVASAWVQTLGGVDPFTGNHLFTCFRAMEWKTQIDMIQPLRQLKAKKSYYENPSHGKWKLTGIGLEAAKAIVKA
jgi:hypothetical protein